MDGNKDLFENTPINKAVISLVVPTVISQLITVVYNMADTFFIGQIGDPNQVAAAAPAVHTLNAQALFALPLFPAPIRK